MKPFLLPFNPLPTDKILHWSKLKVFGDDKINAAEMMISFSDRVENIVGKEENAGYQDFLLFPQCFQTLFFSGSLKVGIVCERVNQLRYMFVLSSTIYIWQDKS